MLASAETISVVARMLKEWSERTGKEIQIVLDPVRLLYLTLPHGV
jgi:hydroxymethylpyrimidine/phosphomethylpyrimidine kinase